MANHAVLIVSKVEAKNVDARLRPVICASAIDNGNIFVLNQKTGVSGEGEVFLATAPSSASQTRLWIACEPELSFATAGDNIYNGLGNIQDFYTSACKVFTAFRLEPNVDIITLTAEAFDSATPQAYAVPDDTGNFKWIWAAAPSTGECLKYLKTTYIPCASASAIGDGRIVAFQLEAYKA